MDTRAQTQRNPRPQAHETIAEMLTEQGLDARAIDGWVYVALKSGRVMCISAEYGQSLEVTIYPNKRVLG